MAIYKQLAAEFVSDFRQKKRKPGERMPSLRQLSHQRAVSMSTAVSCYQELEASGWIQSRPQAGYFVQNPHTQVTAPDLSQFTSKLTKTIHHNPIYNSHNGPLGISGTSLEPQTSQALERSFRRVLRRHGSNIHLYPDAQGESMLRMALSQHFSKQGFSFSADDYVVTGGCMAAIKTAIESCTEHGQAIAISSPCFSGIIELIGQLNRQVIEIPSLPDGVDLVQLEQHLKRGNISACLFCTSHMNPQGISMSSEQKLTLAELASRYQTPVIEDDVYIELSHSEHVPLPTKYYDKKGFVLWCGSISKTLSPGYRLGWCLPGRFQSRYVRQLNAGSFGVAKPTQLAIADFIDTGQYAKQLRRRRQKLLEIKQAYIRYLVNQLGPDVKISQPQGGMVLWLQIPNLDEASFEQALAKNKIDVRLGKHFTTLPLYRDCVRINVGHPLSERAKEQLDGLVKIIQAHSTVG